MAFLDPLFLSQQPMANVLPPQMAQLPGMLMPRPAIPAPAPTDFSAQVRHDPWVPESPGGLPTPPATGPAPTGPSLFSGANRGGLSAASPALLAIGMGLMSGDPSKGLALGMQAAKSAKEARAERAKQTATYNALIKRGLSPEDATAAVLQPELLKSHLQQLFSDKFEPVKAPEGTIIGQRSKTSGKVEPYPQVDTNDIREYGVYRRQATERGETPISFIEFDIARKKAGASNINVGGENLTPGWKAIDTKFAEDYIKWQGGGYADSIKKMAQLGETSRLLQESIKEGKPITGVVGMIPQAIQPFVNEKGVIAKEAIEEVVQRNLRETLGAQFTEREGERLIARAFNPLLPPEENLRRTQRLVEQVKAQAEAKQAMVEYFDQHGTLRGYKGPRPTMPNPNDIGPEVKQQPELPGGQAAPPSTGPLAPGRYIWDPQRGPVQAK